MTDNDEKKPDLEEAYKIIDNMRETYGEAISLNQEVSLNTALSHYNALKQNVPNAGFVEEESGQDFYKFMDNLEDNVKESRFSEISLMFEGLESLVGQFQEYFDNEHYQQFLESYEGLREVFQGYLPDNTE